MSTYKATRAKQGNSYVSTEDVAQHVAWLRAQQMSCCAIADAAGVHHRTIQEIGKRTRIRADLADAILGVTPADASRSVPRQFADLLIDALSKAGLRRIDIARSLRVTELRWGARWVQWRTYERLRTLYELLAHRGYVAAELLDDLP